MKFRIAEKYILEIHWDKVIYEQEDMAKLYNCYLSGPVLKEVTRMNEKDFMDLDFGHQYVVFINHYYIAKFSWEGVRRTPDRIFLNNVLLTNKNVNAVPKLNNDDYILIDTKDHVDRKHQYTLTYPSYLIRFDGDKYDFAQLGGK
jgi:hypothetical protein